jgi:uncharacterized protein YdaU (DUF1376 family)
MHFYPHHIGDFQRDTASLSDSDTMAYLRLIWMYYDTEQPLPADAKKLAFKIGSNPDSVQMILDTFFIKEQDFYRHKRCDKVLNEIYDKSEKARLAALTRWAKNADAMPAQSERNADASKNNANATKNDATHNPIPNIVITRGTRLSTDWELSEDQKQFCIKERPDLDPIKVAAGFKDYWISVAGSKGVKKDWDATWRNWVRNQRVTKSSNPSNTIPEWKLRFK